MASQSLKHRREKNVEIVDLGLVKSESESEPRVEGDGRSAWRRVSLGKAIDFVLDLQRKEELCE